MIYEIRGQKVMLDFELAKIYGYETKRFNEQVKNNINKFPERYRFQLSWDEVDFLRSKKSDLNSWSKKSTLNKSGDARGTNMKYLPYAFTEQGIYMLMTVLKGELATRQSIALIDAFKQMKDYIVENDGLLMNTNPYLESRFASIDKRFEVVEHKIDVVMDNFIDESTHKHFIILDGEKIEADVAYQSIYSKAKSSILVIDDYIGAKTLQLLKASMEGVAITIVSDNRARSGLNSNFVRDSGLAISFKKNGGRFHDRYIILDYGLEDEKFYHCGASSKDAGKRITAINELGDGNGYHPSIDMALSEPDYSLE
jgi:phage regulator Rha-like protein